MKKIILLFFFRHLFKNLYSDIPHFVDFKYILNNSEAGKKLNQTLKSKLDEGLKNLKIKSLKFKMKKKLFNKKNSISPEEYKKQSQ